MKVRSPSLPLEDSWLAAAGQKLEAYYRKASRDVAEESPGMEEELFSEANEADDDGDDSKEPSELDSIDRFLEKEFRLRFFQSIGHRYVIELRRVLGEENAAYRRTKRDINSFLSVAYSTASRWGHDHNLAGAHYYFVTHALDLDCDPGSLKLPNTARMRRLGVVSFMRHIRFKFLGVKGSAYLSDVMFEHLVNLMAMMTQNKSFIYNPYNDAANDNLKGIAAYANELFRSRNPSHNYSSDEVARHKSDTASEVKQWLDDWGLAYTLLAAGYRREWHPA